MKFKELTETWRSMRYDLLCNADCGESWRKFNKLMKKRYSSREINDPSFSKREVPIDILERFKALYELYNPANPVAELNRLIPRLVRNKVYYEDITSVKLVIELASRGYTGKCYEQQAEILENMAITTHYQKYPNAKRLLFRASDLVRKLA